MIFRVLAILSDSQRFSAILSDSFSDSFLHWYFIPEYIWIYIHFSPKKLSFFGLKKSIYKIYILNVIFVILNGKINLN